MILYLDSSALVKRYVAELGSSVVSEAISQAAIIATGLISRAEVAAALAKAMRIGALTKEEAQESLQTFRSDWPDLMRVRVTEAVVARADALAWEWGLRGYENGDTGNF
jgi:predicted nucleic acid-binding protein